ncbi:SRC1 [Sanghuangporus vaninii]
MSRPTTSQIIGKGDYLQPDFNPKTLTIPHLIGIFAYHQIPYPPQHNKAKLVEIFDEEIKKNYVKLRKEWQERQDTLASEEGIVNGVTGSPVQKQPVRRSSRRASREPSSEPAQIEPTRRRRASAEPRLGRARRTAPKRVEVISEESEDEQPQVKVEEPPPKIAKKRDSEAAGPSRRVSQKFGPGTEDSGWEDYNIFQSGAESSSPVRLSTKKARKSALRRRTSFSAPPEMPPSPPKAPFTPPHFDFSSELPPMESRTPRWRLSMVKQEASDDYYDDVSGLADVSAAIVVEDDDGEEEDEEQQFLPHDQEDQDQEDEEEVDELEDEENELEDSQTVAVAQKIAEGGQLVRKGSKSDQSIPLWQRIAILLLVLALSSLSAWYKIESAPIGYCDTGSHTNDVLLDIRKKREETESCYAEHSEDGKQGSCPPLPLIPLPRPEACTPCPAHATCSRFSVRCDDGYILSPHPLSRIPYLSELANGLPGLGPIAFPPRCVDDELRKKHIGRLGKLIDTTLAETRGNRICTGIDPEKPIDGGEARKWGYDYEDLKSTLYKKEYNNREDGRLRAEFDAMFQEAMGQLKKYGRIIEGKDSSGRKYIASDHADMTWSCKATVALRRSWAEWRSKVFGTIGLILFSWYLKVKNAQRREEKQRVAELVQIALDELREVEMRHHTDPVTTPHPYLSSVQLRDLILQDEHDPQVRRRLWGPVERVIEGNANVRVNCEELRGGEEDRVWTWVGSTGLASPSKKRVSLPSQSPSRE